jgi:hypothetical protein
MRHPTRVDPSRHDHSLSTRIDLAPSGSGIASHEASRRKLLYYRAGRSDGPLLQPRQT